MLTLRDIARAAVAQGLDEDQVIVAMCGTTANAEQDLRDKFAMAALQGLLSNIDEADERLHRTGEIAGIVARCCYEFADAMLKARLA